MEYLSRLMIALRIKAPPEPEGPPPLMKDPWRSYIRWSPQNRQQLLEDINNFEVKGDIPYLNCLLLGQSASGKTSFFNTCATALKDEQRMITPLTVYKSSESSVTRRFETRPLIAKEVLKLRIFDCRGLHDEGGVTPEDIRLIVDGHIKHGYKINQVKSISHDDPYYLEDPGLRDMMHCVVYAVNAANLTEVLAGETAKQIFEDMRDRLVDRHVPQLVLMNKVDRLRTTLAEDITKLFHSTEVKKKLDDIASFTNLPEMKVLPMCNYHDKIKPNTNNDILALTNLKTIMESANDFVGHECATNVPSDF